MLKEKGVKIGHVKSGARITVFLRPSQGNANEQWATGVKRMLKLSFEHGPGKQDYPGKRASRADDTPVIRQFKQHLGLSIVEPGDEVIAETGKPLAWHVAVSEKDSAGASLLKILMSMYGKK